MTQPTVSKHWRKETPCGWGVKAGMVRVWLEGKTVWSDCYTQAISECFRDKWLIIKHYMNSSVLFWLFTWTGEPCQYSETELFWANTPPALVSDILTCRAANAVVEVHVSETGDVGSIINAHSEHSDSSNWRQKTDFCTRFNYCCR